MLLPRPVTINSSENSTTISKDLAPTSLSLFIDYDALLQVLVALDYDRFLAV